MKFSSLICLVAVTTSTLAREECTERKMNLKNVCLSCTCKNEANTIRWDCNRCDKTRQKRDVPIAIDLKKTPCAANDQFHVDCNTCYCNTAGSGYLCTQRSCPPGSTPQDFTTSKPGNITEDTEIAPNNDFDEPVSTFETIEEQISTTTIIPTETTIQIDTEESFPQTESLVEELEQSSSTTEANFSTTTESSISQND